MILCPIRGSGGLAGNPGGLQQIANIKLKILLNLFSYFYCVFYFREINSQHWQQFQKYLFFFLQHLQSILNIFFFCQNFQQKLWTKINIFGENTGFKMFVILFIFFFEAKYRF